MISLTENLRYYLLLRRNMEESMWMIECQLKDEAGHPIIHYGGSFLSIAGIQLKFVVSIMYTFSLTHTDSDSETK